MPMLETVATEGNLRVVIAGRGLKQMSPTERDLLRRILRLAPSIRSPLKASFDVILMNEPTANGDELLAVIRRVGQPADFF